MGDDSETWEWIKSPYSASENCVEVAFRPDGVAVRDSKDRQGPRLWFTPAEWDAFRNGMKAGNFDRP
ncbi:DUF397 domain-containing protein [Microbispora sp. RL4-1S]|uniref:DUF397 domain-containing protein n=1 Tax=Microbispora oryzae TaxID=2806554 RepID=A0A940WGH2_9ACTN|nr:DUF397 domain-containing protein [Microbispora oryzae]MBP2704348.1 DUF397 domain-containing protein [Microbispora oryzae]